VRVVSAVAAAEALQVVRRVLEHAEDENSCNDRQPEPPAVTDLFMAVVVDCCMIDDPQVVESLQLCQSSNPRIPLILLTPFGCRFQDDIHGLDIKFATHVSKPIKESQLRGALMSLISNDAEQRMTVKSIQQANPGSKTWTRRLNSSSHLSMDEGTGKKYPLRILIAEDNTTNQKVLVRLLQKLGYNADVVGNGIEAVSAALRQSYDVILMDCFMPEMDGLEATKHIRRHVQPCPVIVAVTAAALEEEKKACLQAGLHMYISKPIKAELLICTLYKCWQVKMQEISVDSLHLEVLSSLRPQRQY
jgi:CheY-like chemotaxis protein